MKIKILKRKKKSWEPFRIFFLLNTLILIYFFKYETIETHARAFLTLIILAIGTVQSIYLFKQIFISIQKPKTDRNVHVKPILAHSGPVTSLNYGSPIVEEINISKK